mgnify:FL=1
MNQKGFANIVLVVIIVLIVGVVGYFAFVKKSPPIVQQTQTPTQTNNSVSPTPTQKDETANWKTYSNSKYRFSLKYPNGWTIEESTNADTTGRIISLRSPETAKLLQERKIDLGYSYNLVVSFWPNINNEYARGGSWIGQRNYTSLADFFTDKNAPKQKTGNITIDGQTAYEVIIGGAGANYGVMIEHNGVYELSFETAWDKSKLGSAEKQILSTFQFSK